MAFELFDTALLDDPLFQRQIELEEEMRGAGVARFRANLEKSLDKDAAASTKAGMRIVNAAHPRVEAAIEAFIKEAESGGAGRRHSALKFVKKLPVPVVANVLIRTVVDSIMSSTSLTQMAVSVGANLEAEVNASIFAEKMPKAYKKFHEKAKKENLARRQWSHLLFPARLLGVELEEWEQRDRLLVGTKLVELMEESTKLIKLSLRMSRGSTVYYVEPTAETMSWIEGENARLEGLFPVCMPTIIPPKPWTSPFDGGYYTIQNRNFTLVKSKDRQYLEELSSRSMPTVYAAINSLQDTPWAVNTVILEVMEKMYEADMDVPGVPRADDLPAPVKPSWMPEEGRMSQDDMTEEQLAEFKAWKAEAHRIYEANAKARGKRFQFLRTISVAKKFKDEEAIYFPHQLDWRGRAYPMPLYLHPQGADVQRGLLTFADALPISDQIDADWLAIHGAGMWGFDKVALEDRVQWVKDHEQAIIESAMDPIACDFWRGADKPWQFLAFCFEWLGFYTEGFGYLSSIPVQMDGTCNGLQNFSAMLLDEIGGAAVNLIPSDKPQDIYAEVAKLVAKAVEDDLFNEDEEIAFIARGWHGHITRSVTKRPVMTLAYGAKRFGFVSQVEEDTLREWREKGDGTYPFILTTEEGKTIDIGYKAASYMGGLIWDNVAKVVVAARAAMDWLQDAAQAVSGDGLPINWQTPSGMLVNQAYRQANMRRIDTTFNSTRIRLHLADKGTVGKIDKRKQASGISPNWVHSLDASHLMLTIERAAAEGIRHFSMIHDSYGTHAANSGALARFLREEFVRMYAEVDVLERFRSDLMEQTGVVLSPVPPKGNLDLNEVLESPFFFA